MSLNKAQLEAINTIFGNVAVIATAGSGKTTVLTKRIENMVQNHHIKPFNILAVTFSKKAKESIIEKLKKLEVVNVNVETFHSLALKIIIHKYGTNTYKVWTLQWEKEKCIQDICTSLRLCRKDDVPYNEIYGFIAKQKNLMVTTNLKYSADDPFKPKEMQAIYTRYEAYKKDKKYIEFDDFLNMANDIIDNCPLERKYFQSKYKYILSDEFQDISMSQSLLLKKLNNQNTMIVGDPLQAIYSFRGGNSKYILNFDQDYSNTKIINLNTNYRCSQNIVETANALAQSIPDSKHRYYVESIANNPRHSRPQYHVYFNEYEEAEKIAEKIHQLLPSYQYQDTAILARTNAQLGKVQTVFHEYQIPFDVVEGTLLTDLPEIKLLMAYLKLSLDETDNQMFEYLYNKPTRWLDKKFLEDVKENSKKRNIPYYNSMMSIDRRNWRFKNGIDEIYEVINYLQNKRFRNVGEMIQYLRTRLNIDDFVSKGKVADDGSFSEQTENMNAFENIANQYSSLDKFIETIEKINQDVNSVNPNRVNLLTIHKSKGLEFPVVFIIGCNDELLPHAKSDDIDDEKRLFYVAITRAEKELYISSTLSYNSRLYYTSPFIESIESTIVKNCKKKSKEK